MQYAINPIITTGYITHDNQHKKIWDVDITMGKYRAKLNTESYHNRQLKWQTFYSESQDCLLKKKQQW